MLDAHFTCGELAYIGEEALRRFARDFDAGFVFENPDRADFAFRDAALTADHRQEPARIGVLFAAHIQAEPDTAACERRAGFLRARRAIALAGFARLTAAARPRTEEHTSELQSLMG